MSNIFFTKVLTSKLRLATPCIALVLLFNTSHAIDISSRAVPFVSNYHSIDYEANTQNWAVAQDANGVMWFGNAAGALWYDGFEWGRVQIPNNSIVRSIKILNDNTLLVGAFGEYGSITRDSTGSYVYNSWVDRAPTRYSDIPDVWRIHELNNEVFIQTYLRILVFSDGKFVRSIEPTNRFRFSFAERGNLYIEDQGVGLKVMTDNNFELVERGDFFADKEVWFIGRAVGSLLVGTQKDGLFILRNGYWQPWGADLNNYLMSNSLYCGTQTERGNFLFGTILGGIIQANANGTIQRIIDRDDGLQNNTVLSIAQDREGNIWAGLDIGISHLKIASPFSLLARDGVIGMGYSATKHKENIYLGTNQGVFTYQGGQQELTIVPNSEGQVWSFFSWGGNLLCLHHNGVYLVDGMRMARILDTEGCWKALPIPGHDNKILIGTYNGLWVLERSAQGYNSWRVEGLDESCRIIEFDDNNNLWMSHGYKGVYRIDLNEEMTEVSSLMFFGKNQGLPTDINNEIFKFEGKILILTIDGFYHYNSITMRMEPYSPWNNILDTENPISKVIPDPWGRLYIFSEGIVSIAIIRNDSLLYHDDKQLLTIRNRFLPSFENIHFTPNGDALFGTEYGFVLFERSKLLTEGITLPLHIKELRSSQDGTFSTSSNQLPFAESKLKIPYTYNNIQVKVAAPHYLSPQNLQFTYTLNGRQIPLNTDLQTMHLNNLREGKYELKVTVADATSANSANTLSLNFEVDPPFYREWWAYLLYVVLFILISLGALLYLRRRVKVMMRRQKLRDKRKMIQEQIALRRKAEDSEREVVKLRNEQLKTDMKHKNMELANAAYHITQQNKLLTNLKDEVAKIIKVSTNESVKSELRKISRKIEKDIKKQNNWEVFNRYFEEVHEEFLEKLQSQHPDLSPSEMRLSAYLRMNISTKEIAPLMNISVRGVEISRYRLRKKLKLDRDTNLISYIMQI